MKQSTTHPPTLINPTNTDIADAAIDRAQFWGYPLASEYTVSLRIRGSAEAKPRDIEVTHKPGEGLFVGERRLVT